VPAGGGPAAWGWPASAPELVALQERLAAAARAATAASERWHGAGTVGGCFLAYARGEAGPGHPGDHAWAAATVVDVGGRTVASVVVAGQVPASYAPGLLALREGPLLASAVGGLARPPDVLLVDATGADHPRHAGLATHLGAVLGVATVGVTHRPLRAGGGDEPGRARGAWTPLVLDGEVVAARVRTRVGAHAVVAHAGWRTTVEDAVAVVLATSTGAARTPAPLQVARTVARTARAAGGAAGCDDASTTGGGAWA
jgi:deoxyribonuclease V